MPVGAPSGPVVDTGAAQEFLREILGRATEGDLAAVGADCRRKSDRFAEVLGDGRAARASRADLREVLRRIFSCRRKADMILEAVGPERLAAEIDRLLRGLEPVGERIERFDAVLEAAPGIGFDLPGELLHFAHPEHYWLWTRWMWDPRIETGALRLVTTEELDLVAEGRGATYVGVGRALAFVNETGRAAGFTTFEDGPFGIDVFLACVYAVYMYTVLRMRMTQEFNRIVPGLEGLVRTLLGVRHQEA